ncbi:MAG: CDP-paratose 2-epimerase [Candidatus Thorarchaeota archaeon]|nr:MAG: CDP-paratose 2-epimerase [Candidatus Thorarchaeota archaeon]
MQVLVTGAFGNVGESTLMALLEKGYYIRCFDLPTKRNEKTQKKMEEIGDFQTVWGDIRDYDAVSMAALNMETIIHLAAIIPPVSDINPDLAREVNVGGTSNLLKAAQEMESPPKFIYASSIATYGHCTGEGPPKTASDPQQATDPYTEHKIECEKLVKASDLPWTILRFGVVTPLSIGMDVDPIMFEIPLEQRIEFVHTRDIGLACANAVEVDAQEKILLLGGGESCRMTYRHFVSKMLDAMGIGMLPDSAFKEVTCDEDWFHTDWMDTEESQKILDFQKHDFEDFLEEYKELAGIKRYLAMLFRPLVRRRLLAKSPYYGQ